MFYNGLVPACISDILLSDPAPKALFWSQTAYIEMWLNKEERQTCPSPLFELYKEDWNMLITLVK